MITGNGGTVSINFTSGLNGWRALRSIAEEVEKQRALRLYGKCIDQILEAHRRFDVGHEMVLPERAPLREGGRMRETS